MQVTVLCNWIFRKTSSAVGVHPVNMTPKMTISSTEVIFGAPIFRFRSILGCKTCHENAEQKTESYQIGTSPADIRYAFFLMYLSSLDMCRKARRSRVTSRRLVLARLLPDVASTNFPYVCYVLPCIPTVIWQPLSTPCHMGHL